jgi:hypothetical protein
VQFDGFAKPRLLAPLEAPEKVTEMLARELDSTIRVYDTE